MEITRRYTGRYFIDGRLQQRSQGKGAGQRQWRKWSEAAGEGGIRS
ncbi:hypothetical protein NCCP2331_05880 [Sporosarcina sp. NCCP-2331]|nr:hypothetical protein NCCP2331_05880 [Sporosarcina sp. NCCP-2331]GLB55180.1 hypothetical protein NCCP2378_09660 [Sporosarcina sp. NCCP-2378]